MAFNLAVEDARENAWPTHFASGSILQIDFMDLAAARNRRAACALKRAGLTGFLSESAVVFVSDIAASSSAHMLRSLRANCGAGRAGFAAENVPCKQSRAKKKRRARQSGRR